MKPFAWLALVLLLMQAPARPQTAATPAATTAADKQGDYTQIVNHFFAMVKAGRYNDAAHVLVDTDPKDAYNVDKHEAIAVPLQKIESAFGAFKGFDPIVTKTLGHGVGYVYGLALYEKGPMRYEFIFYKDGTDWRLLHVDFNLNYIPEIRELAGVHIPATAIYPPDAAGRTKPPETPVTPSAPAIPSNPPATAPAPSAPAPPAAPQPQNPPSN